MKFGLYALKHLNTTETARILGVKAAAIQNAESEDMIRRHYDVEHDARINAEVKKINNPL